MRCGTSKRSYRCEGDGNGEDATFSQYKSNSSQNGKKIYREAAKDAKEIFNSLFINWKNP
jgi:hypothetical protein